MSKTVSTAVDIMSSQRYWVLNIEIVLEEINSLPPLAVGSNCEFEICFNGRKTTLPNISPE